MNIHRIYEQVKEPFGKAAARALAETRGAMFDELRDTVAKEDSRLLKVSIDASVSGIHRDGRDGEAAAGSGVV